MCIYTSTLSVLHCWICFFILSFRFYFCEQFLLLQLLFVSAEHSKYFQRFPSRLWNIWFQCTRKFSGWCNDHKLWWNSKSGWLCHWCFKKWGCSPIQLLNSERMSRTKLSLILPLKAKALLISGGALLIYESAMIHFNNLCQSVSMPIVGVARVQHSFI